jgi:IclR family acetate operon transcriptional repressor
VRAAERDDRSVLAKAFRVLDAFGSDATVLTLSDLARRAHLPKSTAHRIVVQLLGWGGLERAGAGFRLGTHLFELGNMVPPSRRLREAALPFMEDLYESAHETVHLGVLEGDEVLYLEKIGGHRQVRVPTAVGARMPLHCTALGKAILAFSPPDLLDRVLTKGLARRTSYTITVPAVLRAELATVALEGVAFDREESVLSVACTAAPVVDRAGGAVAALSVTGATTRFDPQRLAPAVKTAALGLSRALWASLRE